MFTLELDKLKTFNSQLWVLCHFQKICKIFFGKKINDFTELFVSPFSHQGDYIASMHRISIPATWDVIWGQNNPFLTLDRPPNFLIQKDRVLKAFYSKTKVLSKESHPQVKKLETFFREFDLSEFWSDFIDYYMKRYLF